MPEIDFSGILMRLLPLVWKVAEQGLLHDECGRRFYVVGQVRAVGPGGAVRLAESFGGPANAAETVACSL